MVLPYGVGMRSTVRALAIAALLVAAPVASACAPGPPTAVDETATPTPTPTSLTNEDIAAAKQAYLNYVDALSKIDLTSRETVRTGLQYSTGNRLQYDLEELNELSDKGWTISGTTRVVRLEYIANDSSVGEVALHTCLDVTDLHYFDETGTERRQQNAADVVEAVAAVVATTASEWKVSAIRPWTGEPTCS